jgi:hypothetical protein
MIQPEFKSLSVILSDKLFRIPEYQRHYIAILNEKHINLVLKY